MKGYSGYKQLVIFVEDEGRIFRFGLPTVSPVGCIKGEVHKEENGPAMQDTNKQEDAILERFVR